MSELAPLKVLLAEDEPAQRLLMSRVIGKGGYLVDTVADGEAALEQVAGGEYQMLITNWEMPRLNGAQLCRRIRELALPGYLYVLLLTGHCAVESVVAGLDAGADDYLRKPVDGSELLARLNAGRRIVRLERTLRTMNARMHLLSITDALLGIFNRRYLNEQLNRDIERAYRYKRPLALIATDLDRFKTINDRFGHMVGDQVLKAYAGVLSSSVRQSTDWVARFGGEEFVIVLPGTDLTGAAVLAEKMRARCEATLVSTTAGEIRVTATFGVADIDAAAAADVRPTIGEQADQLLRRADAALYLGKDDGRNCVRQHRGQI